MELCHPSAGCRNQEVRALDTERDITDFRNMSSEAGSPSELILVVLGRTEPRQRICAALNLQDKPQGTEDTLRLECSKHRGEVAGRQLDVVSSPAWFSSQYSSEDRRRLLSSFISLSGPGPRVFLLCVPVHQRLDGENKALDVLEELLGASSVRRLALLILTHTEELEEDEGMEEFLLTWRKDLLELVVRCGERYHTVESRGGKKGEEDEEEEERRRRAVEELLGKVEQVVREWRDEEEEEEVKSVDDLDLDSIFPPASFHSSSFSSSSSSSSFWGLWEWVSRWASWLPSLVRREALLGALVGLLVGGPYGGVVGASVGSVATEVKRRKTQKTK